MMNELRRDPLTGTWVAIAVDRQGRPSAFLEDENGDTGSCPFCPGNEGATPPEITRVDDENGNWLVRVIPNLYPIFCDSAQAEGSQDSRLFSSLPGLGRHEVIIETPDHHNDLADLSSDQAVAVVESYAGRVAVLSADPHVRHVSVFRNLGKSAGASLAHPHAQVVAAAAVPEGVWKRIELERRYHREVGRCLICDLLDAAPRDQRLIEEAGGYVLWAPYAARFSYEMRMASRDHHERFDELRSSRALAGLLQRALKRLLAIRGKVAYNVVVQVPPTPLESHDLAAVHPWYLEILPRIGRIAGYELSTGIMVNTVSPEAAASDLRGDVNEQGDMAA